MLVNKLEVTVAAGQSLTAAHEIAGIPTYIMPLKPSPIAVTSADAINIVFYNPSDASATATFFIRRDHSILSDCSELEYWAGFIDQTGDGGGGGSAGVSPGVIATGPITRLLAGGDWDANWYEFDGDNGTSMAIQPPASFTLDANGRITPTDVGTAGAPSKYLMLEYVFTALVPMRLRFRYKTTDGTSLSLTFNSRVYYSGDAIVGSDFSSVPAGSKSFDNNSAYTEYISPPFLPGAHHLQITFSTSGVEGEDIGIDNLRWEPMPSIYNHFFDDFRYEPGVALPASVWSAYATEPCKIEMPSAGGTQYPYGAVYIEGYTEGTPTDETCACLSKHMRIPVTDVLVLEGELVGGNAHNGILQFGLASESGSYYPGHSSLQNVMFESDRVTGTWLLKVLDADPIPTGIGAGLNHTLRLEVNRSLGRVDAYIDGVRVGGVNLEGMPLDENITHPFIKAMPTADFSSSSAIVNFISLSWYTREYPAAAFGGGVG